MSFGKRLVIIGLTGSGLLYVLFKLLSVIFLASLDVSRTNRVAMTNRVFAASIIRVAFDGDFYKPDSTWALTRVYLCTVIERNLAEIIADLPASFGLLRSVRNKTNTFFSRDTRGSTKASDHSEHFRLGSEGRQGASARSANDGSVYNEDEIPLKPFSHVPKDNRVVYMETSIDIRAESVDTQEHEQRRRTLVHPWDKNATIV